MSASDKPDRRATASQRPCPAGSAQGSSQGAAREADWPSAARLSPREWLVAAGLAALAFVLLPVFWGQIEPFEPGPDYRIPFRLGDDYWMYRRYCERTRAEDRLLLVGDSVIWGHYVSPRETLSHYLSELAGKAAFANLGVDGIHPAAMAGLVEHYGRSIAGKKVILFCNPLWMSSPTHDLQTTKEFSFNHPRLVPQFFPRIPCYKEPLEGRLGAVIQRGAPFLAWVGHVRAAYFDNSDVPTWSLEHPGACPLAAVSRQLPPADEPPSPAPAAEPWTAKGIEKYNPAWGELDSSIQWQSLRRTIAILQGRGNRVFVLVGPFNEHMLKPASLARYRAMKDEIAAWLQQAAVPHCVPNALASELYADASHPLAAGYAAVARCLWAEESFQRFLRGE